MLTGWRYRIVSAAGVVGVTTLSVLVANHPTVQKQFTTYVPLFNRLEVDTLSGGMLLWAIALCSVVMVGCLLPLYKPRPRRVLDTVFLAQKRVVTGGLAIAAFGFFKMSHRLPRATLVMVVGLLSVAIPAWFVRMRRRPANDSGRTLLVGDDPDQIEQISAQLAGPVLGYLCPTSALSSQFVAEGDSTAIEAVPDGGSVSEDGLILEYDEFTDLDRLGGLSRIEDVLVEYDVDTVVLAFRRADRAEFFGSLDACYEHGVDVKVHQEYTDSVLISDDQIGELVTVDLEPWDPIDHLFKRGFDVLFSLTALVALAPVIALIAVAIKLDSSGPVLYKQERTAVFGESFQVYKFRSMVQNAESETGAKISDEDAGGVDPRVTRVGKILRKTHLDEIPQLWAILASDMSVVGPRPERPELDSEIQSDGVDWSKRWFVKPGLTGLAQVNDITGHEAESKLRYDLEYVRRQSFRFDLKIVIRQIWKVLSDIREFVASR
ncbi:sugar transferase [Halostagnicola kamekurae]|uniref:Sugar transferase involved in LPS biosynthesis (Colanic, teichoic acid) n=1 Tax=Halostagnicola kamekurae TaxID=619731 RepID=A0A1I6SQX1_9EURY|nr:sugar transferase [Halostagnicola kamekurae]SFS79385.1 Sugar transferase involved in LPS biosynthesis (colanic, teichoic acid) [Halostagnicola kamekurae]